MPEEHLPEWYVHILPGTAKVLTYRQKFYTLQGAIELSIRECTQAFRIPTEAIIVIEAGLVDKTEAGL